MKLFRCSVLTPHRRLFSGEVGSLSFSTIDGKTQILADHEPIVAPVAVGILTLDTAEGRKIAAVTEGFITVKPGGVELFVEAAEWPEDIDRARAEGSLERAVSRLESETLAWSIARARAAAERARNRLAVEAAANKAAVDDADATSPAALAGARRRDSAEKKA